MCTSNSNDEPTPSNSNRKQRYKLWELEPHLHCSMLGTCLTIADLNKVMRQSGMEFESLPSDFDLHSAMVKEAGCNNYPARSLHKMLEKRYKRWIDQITCYQTSEQLTRHWQQALNSGDIPGNYWALLTHPKSSPSLIVRIHGDVHMLSHLQGATTRHEIKRNKDQELQIKKLQEQLSELRQSSYAKVVRLEAQLRQQEQDITLQKVESRFNKTNTATPTILSRLEKTNQQLKSRLDWTEKRLADRELTHSELLYEREGLEERVVELQDENSALKLHQYAELISLGKEESPDPIPHLKGKQILYVGGRSKVLPHLRDLVENHNGDFIHHDGGLEDSSMGLQNILSKADMVFCPIDCISHDACLRAKRHCKQHAKPFIPLRTSGLSAFSGELGKLS